MPVVLTFRRPLAPLYPWSHDCFPESGQGVCFSRLTSPRSTSTMSEYSFDGRRSHRATPAPRSTYGGAHTGDPPRGLPAYGNWTDPAQSRHQAFALNRDDSVPPERVFLPPAQRGDHSFQTPARDHTQDRPPAQRVDHSFQTPARDHTHDYPLNVRDFRNAPSANVLPTAEHSYGAIPFPYQTDHTNAARYTPVPVAPARHYGEPAPPYQKQPDPAYAWEEFIILRRNFHKLEDKVVQLEELVLELKQFRFNVPLRCVSYCILGALVLTNAASRLAYALRPWVQATLFHDPKLPRDLTQTTKTFKLPTTTT